MLVTRLKFYILPRLSTRQYGFMPQRGTEDALYDLINYLHEGLKRKKIITMISLDIEGAFDSAWWPAVKLRLAEEKCPINIRRVFDSYLRDRKVKVRYAGAEHTKSTTKGCVQGSIGGPILWNLLLDPLLKGLEERGDHCQAFADDIVLVFDGDTGLDISRQANATLAYVQEWGVRNKLKFAPQKTKAMVITKRLKYDSPFLTMGGVDLELVDEIKILGLTIDKGLTFNSHVDSVCKKAQAIYKQLSRAAKVSWGLHPPIIKTIYAAVVEPVVLYAASAWAPAVKKIGVRKKLNAIQRGFAQKITRAYRTVSLNSSLALAGILPLDLRIRETAALYEAKRGVHLPMLGDRVIETRAAYTTQQHPAERIAFQFANLVDREDIDRQNTAVRIFTDGSKIEGKVGAALSWWHSEAETKTKKLKLGSHCTVFQAELLAICRATSLIRNSSEKSFSIFTDSRSSLESVVRQNSFHPLVVEIRDNLTACSIQNKEVSLFWVKAHAGLEGNERADELAKEAALYLKKKPDYDRCPESFVKRELRKMSLDEWNHRYRTGDTAAITKVYFPDAVAAYTVIKKLTLDAVTTQVLTGHGGFSGYLNRFKCKEDPSCICEPGINENILHLLIDCPVHGYERLKIELQIGMNLTVHNLNVIIKDQSITEIFLNYCKNIAGIVIKRNK